MAFLRPTEFKQKRTANTMACFLQAMEGSCLVVELKDYSTVQGTLAHCDNVMNIEMKMVTIHESRHHSMPLHYDSFHIQGKFIRFVHFEHYFNAAKLMRKRMNVSRKPEDQRKRTR